MSLPPRVAAQVWVFLFVAFLGTEPVLGIPEARWIVIVAYAVPVVVLAAARLTRAVDGLDAAVLGTLVVYAAVCLVSPNQQASIETLGLATAFAALFIVARQASSELRQHVAVAAASAFALVLVIHAVLWIREKVAWVSAGGGMPRLESFDVFAWSSPNAIAVVALVSMGCLRWMAPGPVRSAITVVTVAAAVITVPLSVGRSGWLGLAVAAAVALPLLAPTHRRRPIVIGLGAAAGAVAVAVVALAVVGRESVFRLLQGRDVVWSEAFATISSSPLVGVGPGTYPWARLAADAPYADRLSVRLAHNVPLQTAADGGLLLLIAVAALLAFWARHVWRRRPWDTTCRLTIAVLAGFAAMSLFDDQSHLPAVTASIVTLAAWISGPAPRVSARARLVAPIVLGCAAIVALPVVVATTGARVDARDAADAAVAGDWEAAAASYGAAADRHPTNAAYRLGIGLSLARQGDTEGAADAYLAAVSLSPGDPRAYGALAVLQPERAVEWLAMAAERTVTDPQYLVRYGDELLRRDGRDDALAAFGRAVARQGGLYGRLREALGSGGDLRGAAEEVMARSQVTSTTFDAVRWDMALVEGDLPSDAGAPWLAVASALRGDTASSRSHLEAALASAPHDPYTYRAMLAAARLACVDLAGLPDADALLALLVAPSDHDPAVEVAWDQTYREPGLGDYQPVTDPLLLGEWPWPLVGDAAVCERP